MDEANYPVEVWRIIGQLRSDVKETRAYAAEVNAENAGLRERVRELESTVDAFVEAYTGANAERAEFKRANKRLRADLTQAWETLGIELATNCREMKKMQLERDRYRAALDYLWRLAWPLFEAEGWHKSSLAANMGIDPEDLAD